MGGVRGRRERSLGCWRGTEGESRLWSLWPGLGSAMHSFLGTAGGGLSSGGGHAGVGSPRPRFLSARLSAFSAIYLLPPPLRKASKSPLPLPEVVLVLTSCNVSPPLILTLCGGPSLNLHVLACLYCLHGGSCLAFARTEVV